MTQFNERPEHSKRYFDDIKAIASDLRTISRIVEPSPDGSVETPTLYPLDITDDQGKTLNVEAVKIRPMGALDGPEKVTIVQLSNAPTDGVHESMFGLLIEPPTVTSGKTLPYEFRSTNIIESTVPVKEIPPFSEFRQVSPRLAQQYDDGVLYGVAFELRALVTPYDVPHPEEQHPDALEALAESRATIPGVAYMGRLLVTPDFSE